MFLSFSFLVYANQQVCFPKGCVDARVVIDMPALIQGLNGEKSIKDNEGMLYVLPLSRPATFSTHYMLFPIDILWLDGEKKVMMIVRDVAPCREEACPLYMPLEEYAPYALEVNAGYAQKHGIKVGDQFKFQSL